MMLFVLTGLSLLLNLPQEAASDDWRAEESVMLTAPVQLTGPDRFHKAGEAYFSPDDQRIIFQAERRIFHAPTVSSLPTLA